MHASHMETKYFEDLQGNTVSYICHSLSGLYDTLAVRDQSGIFGAMKNVLNYLFGLDYRYLIALSQC